MTLANGYWVRYFVPRTRLRVRWFMVTLYATVFALSYLCWLCVRDGQWVGFVMAFWFVTLVGRLIVRYR